MSKKRIANMVESMPDDWKELLGGMGQRTIDMIELRQKDPAAWVDAMRQDEDFGGVVTSVDDAAMRRGDQ